MGHASTVIEDVVARSEPGRRAPLLFQSLVLTRPEGHAGRTGVTYLASLLLHTGLVVAVTILPLLFYDVLPAQEALKAFFVAPLEVQPPPPPPPPPPAGAKLAPKAPPKVEVQPQGFVAPIEVPTEIVPEEALDLGIEGAPGGVEGGVPGGVVGGVVGGLPQAPPPPARVVRIGGQLVAPRKVRDVQPVYPDLAVQSRVSAVVILEARVDTRGHVKTVTVIKGHPLFDDAALAAVKQWRYQPLLLNGEPTEFILTVTVLFNLQNR